MVVCPFRKWGRLKSGLWLYDLMPDKIYRYWMMVPSGLEEVALDELRERAPHSERIGLEPGGRFGQIFFTYKRSPQHLVQMCSAVHLAGLVSEMHRVTVGRPGLEYICSRVARIDLESIKSLARSLAGDIDTNSFTLSVTLQGRYRFGASELINRVSVVLREKYALREGQGGQLLRFHLQLTGRRALLGLRLGVGGTPNECMIYCQARLLAIQSNASVLWSRNDPGELEVLVRYCKPGLLLGILPRKVGGSRTGSSSLKSLVASRGLLPLCAGYIDYAFTVAQGDLGAELSELARILRFGGVAVIQVDHFDRIMAILREIDAPLAVLANLAIEERGRSYQLIILERLAETDPELLEIGWNL